jgi:hypothetical protein
MTDGDRARQGRAASMAAWVIRLACREQHVDVISAGSKILVALDEIEPDLRWSDTFRADPDLFVATHQQECVCFGEALENSSDETLKKRADDAFLRTDAIQLQSGADFVIATGASIALIIFAIRVGVIEIRPDRFTIHAYKSDHVVSDTLKAAADLVTSLFGGLVEKPTSTGLDGNEPPEAQI